MSLTKEDIIKGLKEMTRKLEEGDEIDSSTMGIVEKFLPNSLWPQVCFAGVQEVESCCWELEAVGGQKACSWRRREQCYLSELRPTTWPRPWLCPLLCPQKSTWSLSLTWFPLTIFPPSPYPQKRTFCDSSMTKAHNPVRSRTENQGALMKAAVKKKERNVSLAKWKSPGR